jgi:type II secretory pathway pseudopilin PulG
MGLIELLIAMTVTAIGIMALVAGLGSGIETIKRSSATSVAGAVADQQMESLRAGSYAAVASSAFPRTGTDGRTYWVDTTVALRQVCNDGSVLANCSANGGALGREMKLVTLTVRDGTSTGRLRIRQSSIFDRASG